MRVHFWGVRGSIPTPGLHTVRYGGNTVCVEVRTLDNQTIILDAGTGMRALGGSLIEGPLHDPLHVFITHTHWDHILGVPFFAPLWRKDAHIIIHALSPFAHRALAHSVMFTPMHFPVLVEDLAARIERTPDTLETARVGSAVVSRIALNHPGGADGFRIDDADGASLVYLTDNELYPPGPVTSTPADLARFSHGASLLIHDAQYLPIDMPAKRGWGHSVVNDVFELARAAEVQRLVLHHHDPDRSDDQLDQIGCEVAKWTQARCPGMETMVAFEGLVIDLPPVP